MGKHQIKNLALLVNVIILLNKLKMDNKNEKLMFFKEWCTYLLDFLELVYKKPGCREDIKSILNEVYEARNLMGMKLIYNDINEEVNHFGEKALVILNEALLKKFGENLIDNRFKQLNKIKRIIKANTIKNKQEFEFVHKWVDNNFNNPDVVKQYNSVIKLLKDNQT
jgi:hypothetical protein